MSSLCQGFCVHSAYTVSPVPTSTLIWLKKAELGSDESDLLYLIHIQVRKGKKQKVGQMFLVGSIFDSAEPHSTLLSQMWVEVWDPAVHSVEHWFILSNSSRAVNSILRYGASPYPVLSCSLTPHTVLFTVEKHYKMLLHRNKCLSYIYCFIGSQFCNWQWVRRRIPALTVIFWTP